MGPAIPAPLIKTRRDLLELSLILLGVGTSANSKNTDQMRSEEASITIRLPSLLYMHEGWRCIAPFAVPHLLYSMRSETPTIKIHSRSTMRLQVFGAVLTIDDDIKSLIKHRPPTSIIRPCPLIFAEGSVRT